MTAAARKLSELDQAKHDFACVYMNTGSEWEDACDHAEFLAGQFAARGCRPREIAERLYSESLRYADM